MSRKSDLRSPRKAARELIAPEVERLKGEVAPEMPVAPTKVEQLEARVKAGRMADPLAAMTEVGPLPDPPPQAGEGMRAVPASPPSLLQRVQYLYEQTVVPVREIARLVGVSERTLYKYVQRYGWQRRHVCIEREDAVRAANRGRTLAPRDGFARAKGTGGRFITFEEREAPQPHGPKALDPLAAEAAGATCDSAAVASNVALSEVIAAATLKDADDCAARVHQNAARVLADAARTLRLLAKAAMAKQQDTTESQERALSPAEQAEAQRRDLEIRVKLARQIENMVEAEKERERQEALRAPNDAYPGAYQRR